METSLHRQLKAHFGPDRGGRAEVVVAGYRIDAVEPDGTLVEVQSAALGPLRTKLGRLLRADYRVRVVKPVVLGRRIVRRTRPDAADGPGRFSPRRGSALDAFDDLVGLACLFPQPNLCIDVLTLDIDEVRIPRRRRPGFSVIDRRLRRLAGSTPLVVASDLWTLLPPDLPCPFTTLDLARRLGRPLDFARRVAYCLRLTGAAVVVGKAGNRRIYDRAGGETTESRRPAGESRLLQTRRGNEA